MSFDESDGATFQKDTHLHNDARQNSIEFIYIEADPSWNQTHATRYGEVIEADVKRDRTRRVDGRLCRFEEMLSHIHPQLT